ncbi:terminase small subunit [Zooshikella ganghwensis]|uniref:terminase small subunit n=1 Tax=Zooshikella ganghwensis TaxID=202772 RepID=UPI0003FF5243|nr:terminase small subunit [Zooshikella ganghwensis]
MRRKLTPKQAMFVKEYLVDLNATQAAIRAGYSKRTAREQAARLLSKVNIQEAIQQIQSVRAKRLTISADRIEQELARIAFSQITDVVEWRREKLNNTHEQDDKPPVEIQQVLLKNSDTLPTEVTATIQEVAQTTHGVRIKLYDKLKALELLGRRHGMFIDKVEHSGSVKHLSEDELNQRIAELTKKLS